MQVMMSKKREKWEKLTNYKGVILMARWCWWWLEFFLHKIEERKQYTCEHRKIMKVKLCLSMIWYGVFYAVHIAMLLLLPPYEGSLFSLIEKTPQSLSSLFLKIASVFCNVLHHFKKQLPSIFFLAKSRCHIKIRYFLLICLFRVH